MTAIPLWHPVAPMRVLRARAEMLARIRAYFATGAVLEVETPACSAYASTDPAIDSLRTRFTGPGYPTGLPLYLHTSPEFPMKRLVAAGYGAIYQICHVYRDGERGRLHSPEFSLLEWYRPGFNHHQLMDDVVALITTIVGRSIPQQRYTYAGVFQQYLDLDPHCCDPDTLQACAVAVGIPGAKSMGVMPTDAWLDLLLTHYIEQRLPADKLTFLYDYPVNQAALAQVRAGNPPVAERFELYFSGMELANGFHELLDAAEQQRRFVANLTLREASGKTIVPVDRHLLAALESGLPSCAGVAIGLDRLLMCITGAKHIDEVLAFPLERA